MYAPDACTPFRRLADPLGALSNMAPGFPLIVNDVLVGSSEALYQCMRFPHRPDVQRLVLAAATPLAAKAACAPHGDASRSDWNEVRVDVMRWCLHMKTAQHAERIGAILESSGVLPIVEVSTRDDFWGAKPREDGAFVGANVLGRLWTEIRGEIGRRSDAHERDAVPAVDGCLLLGEAIRRTG